MKFLKLNNGMEMPQLGLGTFLLSPDEAEESVNFALNNGYNLIDTANVYVNEKAVGRGIKKSNLKREEVFLESKIWPCFFEDENSVEKTLERLNVEYIDLLILHQPAGNYIKAYKTLEKAYKAGKVKAIGVSNFRIDELENLMKNTEIVPTVNQVEAHPYFPQDELVSFMNKHNIKLQSWYPLGGKGNQSLINQDIIQNLAKKYNKSAVQILLRWQIEKGFIVIPGSKNFDHIKDNLNIFDFSLTDEDMKEIAKFNTNTPIFGRRKEFDEYPNWVPDVEGQK